jgi:hypothetical protein
VGCENKQKANRRNTRREAPLVCPLRPTILTTNLDLDKITSIDERIADRLSGYVLIRLAGASWRARESISKNSDRGGTGSFFHAAQTPRRKNKSGTEMINVQRIVDRFTHAGG